MTNSYHSYQHKYLPKFINTFPSLTKIQDRHTCVKLSKDKHVLNDNKAWLKHHVPSGLTSSHQDDFRG